MKNIVENINYNCYLYQQSILNKFEQICEPLAQLGIKSFDYFKIFEDGRYLRLINNLDFSKKFFLTIENNGIFFTGQLNKAMEDNNYYLLLNHDIKNFDKKKDPINHLLYDFNMWNSFLIYKNRKIFMEIYVFQMTREDTEFSQFYLNNLNVLEHFCNYFNDRAKDIIDCSDQRKLASFAQKFEFHNISKEDYLAHQIKQFLQKTYIKKMGSKIREEVLFFSKAEMQGLAYLTLGESVKEISSDLSISPLFIENALQNLKDLNKKESNKKSSSELHCLLESLSPRQQECLFFLTRGKTAKQTARLLKINYRTVQTHIDLLKHKMNCHTKEQLIEKAFKNGFIYTIPQSLESKEEGISPAGLPHLNSRDLG